jgi:uncharacterized membrane protein
MAKKKFDTNPLDPDFPQKARESRKNAALPKNEYSTAEFPPPPMTEEQTRRFDDSVFNDYQRPFTGQNAPAFYPPKGIYDGMNRSSSRKVDRIGLPENVLTALPYIPFWIGMIAGLIILFLVPRSENKVRFHAAQGLAAHLAILIVSFILQLVGNVTNMGSIGITIFSFVTMVMLIIFAVKAWQGKPVHIEAVDDLTEWLEEKVSPRT